MKKPKVTCDLILDPFADYKMEWCHDQTIRNFESVKGWIYIGLDNCVPNRAKVGLTMDDLGSRSSCSGNPDYFLFCAFKCKHDITSSQLTMIEADLLTRLDLYYTRIRHFDSQRLSEWYGGIDTLVFLQSVHNILYTYHHNYFLVSQFENEAEGIEGNFLDCIFNDIYTIEQETFFIRNILEW